MREFLRRVYAVIRLRGACALGRVVLAGLLVAAISCGLLAPANAADVAADSPAASDVPVDRQHAEDTQLAAESKPPSDAVHGDTVAELAAPAERSAANEVQPGGSGTHRAVVGSNSLAYDHF